MEEKIYKIYPVESKVVDAEAGIYEAWVSTESVDRDGDVLLADGAEVENYAKNPIVLFGHNYRDAGAVVAKALQIDKMPGQGIKLMFQFLERGVSQAADLVHDLWKRRFLNAMSVGFIPKKWERRTDENGEELRRGYLFTEWEILEGSIVSVPANQDALRLAYGKIYDRETIEMVFEGEEDKTVIPARDEGKAPEDEAWARPTLSDFTDKDPGDITDSEWRRIARHFAWSANMPPQNYGDLKFPHHRPAKSGVGPAVWRGVANAAARLNQSNVPDKDGIRRHLAFHYRQFDKPVPWEEGREYSDEEWEKLFVDLTDPEVQPESEPTTNATTHNESELNDAQMEAIQNDLKEILEVLKS